MSLNSLVVSIKTHEAIRFALQATSYQNTNVFFSDQTIFKTPFDPRSFRFPVLIAFLASRHTSSRNSQSQMNSKHTKIPSHTYVHVNTHHSKWLRCAQGFKTTGSTHHGGSNHASVFECLRENPFPISSRLSEYSYHERITFACFTQPRALYERYQLVALQPISLPTSAIERKTTATSITSLARMMDEFGEKRDDAKNCMSAWHVVAHVLLALESIP